MAKSISLETKKAYARKSRSANYAASLRLEGFDVKKGKAASPGESRAELIAKYKVST